MCACGGIAGQTSHCARWSNLLTLADLVTVAYCMQDLPGVQVTLVHRGPQLLPTLPARLGSAALWWLQRKGCKVLFNERVDVPAGASGGPFSGTTKGGVQVDCDVLLAATGISVNSAFMQPHLADALDEQGRIKVNWVDVQ